MVDKPHARKRILALRNHVLQQAGETGNTTVAKACMLTSKVNVRSLVGRLDDWPCSVVHRQKWLAHHGSRG